jgi:hypothetical protein
MPSQNSTHAPKAWGAPTTFDFEVPSGGLCLLRRLDPTDLLEHDILEKTDFIGALVDEQIQKIQKGGSPEIDPDKIEADIFEQMRGNASRLGELRYMVDKLTIVAVVEPKVHPLPAKDETRQDGLIYVDTIPFEDKMAIFTRVLQGVNRAKRFHQPDATVAALGTVQDVPLPAKPIDRTIG